MSELQRKNVEVYKFKKPENMKKKKLTSEEYRKKLHKEYIKYPKNHCYNISCLDCEVVTIKNKRPVDCREFEKKQDYVNKYKDFRLG